LPSNRFAFKKIRTSRIVVLFLVAVILAFLGFRFNDILGKPKIDVTVPEVIYPDEEGYFEKRVQLQPGLNRLNFAVKRYLGQETVLEEQVFYQPQTAPALPAESTGTTTE